MLSYTSNYNELLEAELNKRIYTRRIGARMKRKYEYLEALDKGEELPYDPFEFDEDTL
jgi:hypothetical protein